MAARKTRDPLLHKILGASGEATGDASEDASERILSAAVEQAEDFGMRRLTVDDVARRVGLSRVTIYRYFPRKNQLIEAVLLRELRRFLKEVDRAVDECETLEAQLVEGFVFALGYLRRHRLLNRILKSEPELLLPHLTLRAGPVLAAAREFISRFARRDADRGGLALDDSEIEGVSELLARAVLSFVLTPDSVLGLRTEAETRRFAEHYLAPVLGALSSRPATV